ncbi:hypothetical protein DIS24_g11974 [Lasiodiplodia hormozganensis]|uniref:Uncharacterized protein n=1 Tax=Lasiodiplodia hormozganensis TaxID=869390 RepID=A0AA39U6B6_9PEZI|nr:hypothetical protein DIS24_g11974 [Lasiodiplodia hormozganensis]
MGTTALGLARLCHAQGVGPEDPNTISPAPGPDSPNFPADVSITNGPSVMAADPNASPFPWRPGSYTINGATFNVACEILNQSSSELTPAAIVSIAAGIQDYGACMGLCEAVPDECVAAMWDPDAASPCVLLSSYADQVNAPLGRCYAARSGGPGLPAVA